ncbi:MAG: chemotaxis protein CheB [Prolixibacteraceae bacterium]|jgi:two-component system, chemotaxis family, protein-glutamate methylesterase/glutaminase|nr:chemotaxis protein CheB [Prolixibacteraceae bacterium]MBT6005306.1 chemotaxis protein CheB [Prolixibacteraceae bacterium]MBT6765001.1 chemotaxis protein CheB [Prolixibacteraceae bacterium]MBT6999081.1 chemotaxis protein CheB [Prolixibacteraceae bacterium]MBT7396848.1 chemotaxis protein CheB [Prolixibacteraceae bacterium]
MIKAVVIGASYGGLEAIGKILIQLPPKFDIPIIIVLHIGHNTINSYLTSLNNKSGFTVKEAEEKEIIEEKTVYFAPPNYHLQVEDEFSLSLSTDEKVNFSRPAIDVLFETAAWTFKNKLIGVLLTGSNSDGAEGIKIIKKYGGKTIVQNPKTALGKTMPDSAIKLSVPGFIVDLEDIAEKILELTMEN